MRRSILTLISFLTVLSGILVAGTVDGRLVFECTEPASAQGIAAVITESEMRALASGSLDITTVPYALVFSSPWNFSVPGDFDDDSLYYAFGVAVVSDVTLEGNPMGMYPLSPFHTVGGSFSDMEIPMDDTVDVPIIIHPNGVEFTDIYAMMLDMSMGIFSGTDSMDTDFVVPVSDTIDTMYNVPSGLKQVLVFKDENGNGMYDEGEPCGYCQSFDTSFVFAAAGIPFTSEATLRETRIDEKENAVPSMNLDVYPSPFNSELTIEFDGSGGEYDLMIFDVSGKIVHSSTGLTGKIYEWSPQNLSSGIYTIRISQGNSTIEKRAVYLK